MGTCIVKVVQDPADDRYMLWSSVVESFTWMGTRKPLRKHLVAMWGTNAKADVKAMLAQADESGCSTYHVDFGWTDPIGEIYRQRGFLSRNHLVEVWDRLLADPNADLSDLLIPFDTEDVP